MAGSISGTDGFSPIRGEWKRACARTACVFWDHFALIWAVQLTYAIPPLVGLSYEELGCRFVRAANYCFQHQRLRRARVPTSSFAVKGRKRKL
jgi:hypothetical protein